MSRARFNRLPKEKQKKILDAAAEEFATHGYENASLNKILAKAQLSKGSAYYYFEDKADLFGTILMQSFEDVIGSPEKVEQALCRLTEETYWSMLEQIVVRSWDEVGSNPHLTGVLRALWTAPSQLRQSGTIGEMFDKSRKFIDAIIARGQELGAVRRDLPKELLIAWIMALDAATDTYIFSGDAVHDTKRYERIMNRFLDGIRRLLHP